MFNNYHKKIIEEIENTLNKISDKDNKRLAEYISNSKSIFIAGAGRTGLIMKSFAIRLAQMGLKVFVVGEAITPSIKSDNMLIIGSGSGQTESLVAIARKAKKIGVKLALITMSPDSPLAELADVTVEIPVKISKLEVNDLKYSIQPMCNLFEQSLLIFLDSLSMSLIKIKKINIETLYQNHANLE